MSATTVSVIIPVKNDPRVVHAVDSVLACGFDAASLQVIVIDNDSSPEFTSDLIAQLGGRAALLHEVGSGVYRARNRALDAATGDVAFFTDADCVVRSGWIEAGLEMLATGADMVQGYSGSIGKSPVQELVQRRYEAHLLKLKPADPTECDTRNLAVHRRVFETLRFEERYRRVGDTEFGLRAEAAGFRVAYQPTMRVDHEHEPDLEMFAAKQVCHGWGAQRLMQEHPEVEWHGGHLKAVARASQGLAWGKGTSLGARACIRAAILNAALLQRLASRLPETPGFWWLTAIDKLAALGGHLLYRPGGLEPSPSQLLGRAPVRD